MTVSKETILKALVSLALSTVSKEIKTDMLKAIDYGFGKLIKKEYGLTVSMVQSVPDFDSDSDNDTECCSYLEFKSDNLSVIVALEGTWSSYDGYQFNEFYFCRSQPVTKLEYIRE